MGIQSIFRPFWVNALIAFSLGVPGLAIALSLSRLMMEDGDIGHLASQSIWLSWLPGILLGAFAIGLAGAWSKSRAATRYRRAAPGLSDGERMAAAKAVTRGPIPSEPAVRAAARTFAGWFLARSRRGPVLLGGVGLFWVLIAVACVVVGHLYIAYAAVGLVSFVLAWWQWRTRKRVEARWAALAPDRVRSTHNGAAASG
jgi:hypothetical protein